MTSPRSAVFRPDIEGLRAVAIGSVLLYHAGLALVPGGFVGVDIFFVISGFLITSLLLRQALKTGRISLSEFYARRAKRLLPATAVVLAVTAALTMLLAPGSDRRVFGGDIVASAAYLVNWRLAARSVDYLAEGEGPSPVLHFWSLAVEEQFYFVWPFLIIVALFAAKRLGASLRRSTMVVLAAVGLPSFVYSVVATNADQATAFFVTTTRIWELAVGAAVAIAAPRLARLPGRVRGVLAWLGIAALAGSVTLFSTASLWPGSLALVPVLGTAALIAAGLDGGRSRVTRALSVRPMVWIGALSYSLYLWHWPVLIFSELAFGPLSQVQSFGLVVASVVPAYASYRLVENPVRFSRRLSRSSALALAVGAVLTLVGIVAGLLVMVLSDGRGSTTAPTVIVELPVSPSPGASPDPSADLSNAFGAQALGSDPAAADAGIPRDVYDVIIPAPSDAPGDVPAYPRECQADTREAEPTPCSVGDLDSAIRIVALGDSKMIQYYEALDMIGAARGWHIEFIAKSACPSSDATPMMDGRPYATCAEFNEKVMALLEADPPQAVITAQVRVAVAEGEGEPVGGSWQVDGLVHRWQRILNLGVPIAAFIDYPRPEYDVQVYQCMESNPTAATACAYDRAEGEDRSAAPEQRLALAEVPSVHTVDFTRFVCPQERCAPVIGDVLVMRQGSHLTNTYAVTLAPQIMRELDLFMDPIAAQ